jgi:pSer/pThr/pTyr-binding forkhead associated (FHA) protein
MVHVIKPLQGGKTEFKLGRGHESDLRVSDISVSRCHAIIKYDEKSS